VSIAPTLRCPCDGRFLTAAAEYDARPSGETRFDLGGQAYRRAYDRCDLCGHWFGRHRLDLAALYNETYVDATYGGADGIRRKFAAVMALPAAASDNRQRADRVRAFARSRGIDEAAAPRLLDVGAGIGVFPAAMAEAGWAVTAIEEDPRAVAHLSAIPGVDARAASLASLAQSEAGAFQAVTFNKVLEHVEDPAALLAAAAPLVAPRGFVYFEVPDVAAARVDAQREEFFIEHHHVFSPASAALVGERAGFAVAAVERLREPSGKFTIRVLLEAR